MSDLVIQSALDGLRAQIMAETFDPIQAAQVLRALQRRGFSKTDLIVHVERLRAVNESAEFDELVEENALCALETIEGLGPVGLTWDAREVAAAWVPRAVNRATFMAGARAAMEPSDLLPSRPVLASAAFLNQLADLVWTSLEKLSWEPTKADFFRSPKVGLTTRPAALMAPFDRLVFEGLAELVAQSNESYLPPHVVWPRSRTYTGTYSEFISAPQNWENEFVVRTDITNFYETIEHSYLSVLLSSRPELAGAFPIALEAFLDAVMGSSAGLPQGAEGSDILATAYLSDLDREISRRGWEITRFADDILIGASSFEEARARIRDVEALLRDRGLSLANEKTRIIRRETYLAKAETDDSRLTFQNAVRAEVARWFEHNPEAGVVEAIELPEQLQWDVMYHESITWEQALADIQEQVLPPWIWAYGQLFAQEAARLNEGGYPSDQEALSPAELKRCLLFMSADVAGARLSNHHAIINWHPTLVRDYSKYLREVSSRAPKKVANFLSKRFSSQHDSDLEMAWLLSPAIDEPKLARVITRELHTLYSPEAQPLTAATALRALHSIGEIDVINDRDRLARFTPALRAEVLLSVRIGEGALPGPAGLESASR